MKTFGNVEALKKSIQKNYEDKGKKIKQELTRELDGLKKIHKEKLTLIRKKGETDINQATEQEYSKTLNEEKLKAKKDFEKVREQIIDNVFSKVRQEAKKIVHSSEYITKVKKKMPSSSTVIADSEIYKKHFKKITIDPEIIGLKFQKENIIYDFTLDSALDSKIQELRTMANKELFGET